MVGSRRDPLTRGSPVPVVDDFGRSLYSLSRNASSARFGGLLRLSQCDELDELPIPVENRVP